MVDWVEVQTEKVGILNGFFNKKPLALGVVFKHPMIIYMRRLLLVEEERQFLFYQI
jgi:hypothetical protein